jgi:hypothetical protein
MAPQLPLGKYRHVSLHAPSKLVTLTEVELCLKLRELEFPIVVHPDVIEDWNLWQDLGSKVLIENMEKRKPIGRTSAELGLIFERLPEARLCLDVGHSRQIDTSLFETKKILKNHGNRLAEVHLSHVNSACVHESLNLLAMDAFSRISNLIPENVPIILETPVGADSLDIELAKAKQIFGVRELAPA